MKEAQARKLEHELFPWVSYLLAFLKNDSAGMAQTPPASGQGESDDFLLSGLSDTEAFHGRLQSARDLSRHAIATAIKNGSKERAADWQVHSALREAEMGNIVYAEREATAALTLNSGKDLQTMAALVFARVGNDDRTTIITRDLTKRFPTDTLLNLYWVPTIKAALAVAHADPMKAVSKLQVTAPYELGGPPISLDTLYPVYLRGLAYLMEEKGEDAAAEFQKIVGHRGRVANGLLGSLVYLQLAKAYALAGDTTASSQARQRFLSLWENADRSLPILRRDQPHAARPH